MVACQAMGVAMEGEGRPWHDKNLSAEERSQLLQGVAVPVAKFAIQMINACLSPLGIEIIRTRRHDWSDPRNFIPCQETIAAADRSGLSVGDYLDQVINKHPGATQVTIDGMKRLGVFAQRITNVVEIGPGSGRYLEKTMVACSPTRYEIYETARTWSSYLMAKYNVVVQPADGWTLRATPDNSVDLVHAHKVFCSVPSLTTFNYWTEMARICLSGGHVVFDILTETCLGLDTFHKWVNSSHEYGSYPAAMPRSIAIEYFSSREFDLVGTFCEPLGESTTEVFVFRKR